MQSDSSLEGRSILLVDDEDDIRQTLARFLEKKGSTVFTASDGIEAQHIINKNDIELLITDFRMPKMGGMELLKWCQESNLKFPVIVISGEDPVTLTNCCATLLTKPVNMKIFEAAVLSALTTKNDAHC